MSHKHDVQPPDFRYTLKVRGHAIVLTHIPRGWAESLVTWKRSDFYYGMIRSFTTPLSFVLEGAEILRNEFYQFGIEAKADLLIEKLNRSNWGYSTLFEGAIDFSQFKDNLNTVDVTVMEGGISQLMKAYENVVYEIDVDVPEAIEIEMEGIPLQQTFTDIIIPTGQTYVGFVKQIPGLSATLSDLSTASIELQDVEEYTVIGNNPPDFATSDRWFLKNISSETITVNTHLELKGIFNHLGLIISIVNSSGVTKATIFDTHTSVRSEITNDVSFTILPGERIFLYVHYLTDQTTGGGFGLYKVTEGLIKCSFGAAAAPSFCKALRPKYVFDKLIELMAGEPLATQSFHLAEWQQLCLTSGDAIRGITGAKLKTSFRDFFSSVNAVTNIGFGFESGKPVLEGKAYFFKPTLQATHVGTVKNFSLEVADQYIFNSVKVGYSNQNYDELNGRDEFNASQVYSLPVTRIQKEYNIVSPYRADGFGVEFTRINLEGKDSTDSNSDNDTFFIYVKSQPESGQTYYRPERSESYASVSGVLSPSHVFNLKISPKQNLKRHGNFLRSVLHALDEEVITFRSADKNVSLVTVSSNGVRTSENSNLNISTLGDRVFLPYIATVTTALPKNTMSLLDNFPTGFVKFTFKGNEYQGFIIEASVDAAKGKQQEFRLLLTPGNNILKLIRRK